MLAEESSELSVAAHHLNRNLKDRTLAMENLAEEIADVEFMIAELKDCFPDLPLRVDFHRYVKRVSLRDILDAAESKKGTLE